MRPLTKAIQDYLALRRNLGFKLRDAGMVLAKFASFMEQRNAQCITTQLALEWAQQPSNALPALWAQRLSYVRCFARHHIGSDPKTEVPPPGLLPFRPARAHPHLYSNEEVQRLLEAALQLSPGMELRRWTFHVLLGLLSVTGLRVGEALRCKRVAKSSFARTKFLGPSCLLQQRWTREYFKSGNSQTCGWSAPCALQR